MPTVKVPATTPVAPRLIDVHGVAARCGCSWRTVRRYVDAGKMPAPIKVGSLTRWNRDVLDRWIADGCPVVRRAGKGS